MYIRCIFYQQRNVLALLQRSCRGLGWFDSSHPGGSDDVHLEIIPYAPSPALTPQDREEREENKSGREKHSPGILGLLLGT